MASKRQLYQPAPKARAGERKGRKPLVQGRLVTSNLTNVTTRDSAVDLTQPSSSHVAQLVYSSVSTRSSRSSFEESCDPSITPRKSIPALTEIASPLPEPPSTFLDLSDADFGLEDTSVYSKAQPIMVCDASHLASSPNHTEVDVVVEYEDSPARVVCHTPGRLERSLRSNATSESSTQAVVVDIPKTVGLVPARLFADDRQPKRHENGRSERLISQHSRGLIKEILAEEMGSENFDSISLYSHNSSSPRNPRLASPKITGSNVSNRYPLNSSPIDDNEKPCNLTYSETGNVAKLLETSDQSLSCQIRNTSNNQSNSTEGQTKGKTRQGKATVFKTDVENSDSETLSLYEYVSPKKPAQVLEKTKSECSSAGTSGFSQESSSSPFPKSVKKAKPRRVVPSRYKQAVAPKLLISSLGKDSSAENSVPRSFSKTKLQGRPENVKNRPITLSQKNKAVKQTPSKSIASQTSSASLSYQNSRCIGSPQTAVQEQTKLEKDPKTLRQTSTPTHDSSGFPTYIDASSIQSVSVLLSGDASMNLSKLTESWDQKVVSTKPIVDQGTPDKLSPIQLHLEYYRYLQACFFSSKAQKSYKEQDRRALKDLNSLWNLVEKQREEVSKAERDFTRLKQIHHLDNFLDKTEPEIDALIPKLPQVEGDYLKLCQALDTTRHQIPTKDIHLPDGDEDIRAAYEEKMESALKESEMLLNEINKTVDSRVLPLIQYRTCLEAVKQNVNGIGTQLREGQTDLEKAQGLCTRLASLTALDHDLINEY